MDINLINNQLAGLIEKGKTLRQDQTIFLKIQGIDEAIATSQRDSVHHEEDLKQVKFDIEEKTNTKNAAMAVTVKALAEKMGKTLPYGRAIFEINGGKVFLGWCVDNKRKPYGGISGGEKVIFDAALSDALGCNLIIAESAEIDDQGFYESLMNSLNIKTQIIFLTCHPIDGIPPGYNVRKL